MSARGEGPVDGPSLSRPAAPPAPAQLALGGPPDEEVDPDLTAPPDAGTPSTAPTSSATARPLAPPVMRDGMVRIPAGSLHPPSPRVPSPSPIPAFWIDRTEVTVGAYRSCVDAGACARPARASASCTYELGEPSLPISCVHWADAEAYCRFARKRLPTEAEWERAARGAATFPYPWGGSTSCTLANTMTGVFWSLRPCAKHPWPVGSHPLGASPFGVQDVIGNVEEWTADWYGDTPSAASTGPAPRAGAAHVLRGGGWLSTQAMSSVGARDWASAMEAGPNVGFRCARSEDG